MAESSSAKSPTRRFLDRWLIPYLPYPHFMAVAPLDAVLRLLFRPRARIPVVFWPRLAVLVFFSTCVTILSFPERVIVGAWMRWRPRKIEKHAAPIFVLGHFRSGTTFLQTLLAADPMLRSPRWTECLAPQAFVVLWTFLRYMLIPFLPLTGAWKVVPLAPMLPGEDEFAINNWAAASLLARVVLPQAQPFYDRYFDLDSLTPAELRRWQAYERAFVDKLALTTAGRRLVLKSPAHMARVRYLSELFPGAKFVHISRPPDRVFQSNLLLFHTLQTAFALQHQLPTDEQEELITLEYLNAEARYLADRPMIPPGCLSEVRLQDLSADPIGELKRIYRELGLPWSAVYERSLPNLLAALNERQPNQHPELTEAQQARVARLAHLKTTFGHDRPAIAKATLPPAADQTRDALAAVGRGVLAAAACLLAWYWIEPKFGIFLAILNWPVGIALGYAVLGRDKSRSNAMGAFAAGLMAATILVHFAIKANANPFNLSYIIAVIEQIASTDRIIWVPIAALTAFWIASGRPS